MMLMKDIEDGYLEMALLDIKEGEVLAKLRFKGISGDIEFLE